MSKKHSEIINCILELQKENNCTCYLRYNRLTRKIHPIKINRIEGSKIDMEIFPAICTHNVAVTMETKGLLVAEKITEHTSLCKLNLKVI